MNKIELDSIIKQINDFDSQDDDDDDDDDKNKCKKIGIVKPYMNLSSKNMIMFHSDYNNNGIFASKFKPPGCHEKNKKETDETELESDNDDNELFIERMQTISIRKNAKLANSNVYRRKSVHQINSGGFNCNSDKQRESNYWNYDELNELKMKFLSLLSSTQSPIEKFNLSRAEPNRFSISQEPIYLNNPLHSFQQQQVQPNNQFISDEEYAKIESFYKSFGTQLHVTNNLASLYTITLNDTSNAKSTFDTIINLFMLNDDYLISKQNWSVCHRGVPLWLFNTGVNPRRPYRQLKFTLAEKGTGFILWQDRIDGRSDFKIFRKRKMDSNQQHQQQSSSYSLHQENFSDSNQSTMSNLIITFKASDRKTLVFVRFDAYQEVLKFFSYYLKIHNKLCDEIKQRTKSLPAGIGNEILIKNLNQQKKSNQQQTSKPKRETIDNHNISNICIIKYKRISKNEISLPSNLRHLINIRFNDRNSYYTLSKLLPTAGSRQENRQQNGPPRRPSNSISQSPSSSLSTSSSLNEKIIDTDCNLHTTNRFTISVDCKNDKTFSFVSPTSTSSSSSGNYKLKTIK